jgi:hypothetical protein
MKSTTSTSTKQDQVTKSNTPLTEEQFNSIDRMLEELEVLLRFGDVNHNDLTVLGKVLDRDPRRFGPEWLKVRCEKHPQTERRTVQIVHTGRSIASRIPA